MAIGPSCSISLNSSAAHSAIPEDREKVRVHEAAAILGCKNEEIFSHIFNNALVAVNIARNPTTPPRYRICMNSLRVLKKRQEDAHK